MKLEEFEAIVRAIQPFVDSTPPKDWVGKGEPKKVNPEAYGPPKAIPDGKADKVLAAKLYGPTGMPLFNEEELYQRFKKRLINECSLDPTLLHLLTQTPEIIVGYERTVEQVDGTTLRGRVVRLISAGYFKEARTVGSTRRELARTGPDPGGGGSLGQHLADLVRSGLLTREGEGFQQAPGIKITEKEIRSA